MLGRVRVVATWNTWNLGWEKKKGIWVMAWGTVSQIEIFPWRGGGIWDKWCSGVLGEFLR
jgi:hypothetical protein